MQKSIDAIRDEFTNKLALATTSSAIEELKVRFLGRKGPVQELMKELKNVPPLERPAFGERINNLKNDLEKILLSQLETLSSKELAAFIEKELLDITLPGRTRSVGRKHIITQALDEIITIFKEMGFSVQLGPVIETDWNNFGALNTPEDHPARSMQDTFYINKEYLLRTQTSAIQSRVMDLFKPPIRVIAPGKTFRNEEVSARSHVFFHQVDGFYVDKGVTFADLLGTFDTFLKCLFGNAVAVRYRPSYFPFVEPGLEIDVSCIGCGGSGCPICKHSGWLEIAGAGMVHPEVLKNGGIDPEEWTGYAWGMGVERLVMLKCGIPDIRMFVNNDMRFLKQFSSL